MGLSISNLASESGLLRGLLENKLSTAVAESGVDPALQDLVQEPLTRKLPPGTAQIIANKPQLGFDEIESILANQPVPTPQQAAMLIKAIVSPPPPRPAKPATRPRTLGASTPAPLRGAGPLLPGQRRIGVQTATSPLSYLPRGLTAAARALG